MPSSYDRMIADLLVHARDARALQNRTDRLAPRHVEPNAAAPEVVSEAPDPDSEQDGAVLVTYSDGSVWRCWHEFDRGTERVEMCFEQVP